MTKMNQDTCPISTINPGLFNINGKLVPASFELIDRVAKPIKNIVSRRT